MKKTARDSSFPLKRMKGEPPRRGGGLHGRARKRETRDCKSPSVRARERVAPPTLPVGSTPPEAAGKGQKRRKSRRAFPALSAETVKETVFGMSGKKMKSRRRHRRFTTKRRMPRRRRTNVWQSPKKSLPYCHESLPRCPMPMRNRLTCRRSRHFPRAPPEDGLSPRGKSYFLRLGFSNP